MQDCILSHISSVSTSAQKCVTHSEGDLSPLKLDESICNPTCEQRRIQFETVVTDLISTLNDAVMQAIKTLEVRLESHLLQQLGVVTELVKGSVANAASVLGLKLGESPDKCSDCGNKTRLPVNGKPHSCSTDGVELDGRVLENVAASNTCQYKSKNNQCAGVKPVKCSECDTMCGKRVTTSLTGVVPRRKVVHTHNEYENPLRKSANNVALTAAKGRISVSTSEKGRNEVIGGEKPYNCEECGAITGEKPYNCVESGVSQADSVHIIRSKPLPRITSNNVPKHCKSVNQQMHTACGNFTKSTQEKSTPKTTTNKHNHSLIDRLERYNPVEGNTCSSTAIVIVGDSHVRGLRIPGKTSLKWVIPGAKVENVASKLPEILRGTDKNSQLVVCVGSNNLCGEEPPVVVGRLKALLDTVFAMRPSMQIVVIGPMPRLGDLKQQKASRLCNDLLSAACRDYNVVHVSVWHDIMNNNKLVSNDGVHLVAKGEKMLGSAICKVLQQENFY